MSLPKFRIKSLQGMTLIEVIIVITVVVALSLLLISYLRGQILKANDSRRKGDLHKIRVALEEYEKDNNCYPLPQLTVCDPGNGLQPYIDKIPCDPTTNASYYYEMQDSSCPTWYKIYATMENLDTGNYTEGIGPGGLFSFCEGSPNVNCDSSTTAPDNTQYYGCKSGLCVPIYWDRARPGPECDPNYQNKNCYGQCANPGNACQEWR